MNEQKSPHLQPYIIDSMHTGIMLRSVTEPPSGISNIFTMLSAADNAISTALMVSVFTFTFFVDMFSVLSVYSGSAAVSVYHKIPVFST